jgi:hypothetical protein
MNWWRGSAPGPGSVCLRKGATGFGESHAQKQESEAQAANLKDRDALWDIDPFLAISRLIAERPLAIAAKAAKSPLIRATLGKVPE